MTRWLLFFHITSVALWLGGIAALYVPYQKAVRATTADEHALAYATTRSVVRGIINPSALEDSYSNDGVGRLGSSSYHLRRCLTC